MKGGCAMLSSTTICAARKTRNFYFNTIAPHFFFNIGLDLTNTRLARKNTRCKESRKKNKIEQWRFHILIDLNRATNV